ncbi:MAG TPA: M48 family metallopeptidase [Terriglobales bacterium]|nr:M48 family metallopeptidase [Terriglobales bacterium]
MKDRTLKRYVATLMLALLVVPQLFGVAEVPLPAVTGWDMFSPEQDIQLGQQNAAEVRKQMPILPDSNPVSQYVQQLGAKLVATMPKPTWPYKFHVVQQKDINAFALPGGNVFVNLGTIQAAQNEAQLAGVMAHEMSHVYERHSTKQASKQMAAQIPLGVLGALLGGGVAGSLARAGLQFGAGSIFLKYSRDMESQADAVGARIMYNAGYDPVQLANFFQMLEKQGGAQTSQFFSDHPNPGNREEAIKKEIADFPPKNFIENSPAFEKAHQEAMGIKAYSAQQIQQHAWGAQSTGDNGISAAVPAASSAFTTLNHSAFDISYPEDWHVYGDTNSAVTIAPQGGVSQNAVAYGVIINGSDSQNGNSLDQSTQQLVSSLEQSNPGLKQISDSNITVNGVKGKSIDLAGNSPIQGQRERDWLVALPRSDGSLLYAVFIAPDKDFPQLRPTYERMLRSWKIK